MLKYLIILLDDTAVSFCHYHTTTKQSRLIAIEALQKGIFFAMTENLNLQLVYPGSPLPEAYHTIIESVDHTDIKPWSSDETTDVSVIDTANLLDGFIPNSTGCYVWNTSKADFFTHYPLLTKILSQVKRLNVVIADIDTFTTEDFGRYNSALNILAEQLCMLYEEGVAPQLNLLSDRLLLDQMNNCNAGVESVTLAPDGKFYICPAFYYDPEGEAIGDLGSGLNIKNRQLYQLDHAPLCRRCDAYQCRRCVWLNRRTTLEVNTPSHEQCVAAHLERNASRNLLLALQRNNGFMPQLTITKINYLDPFNNIEK
ncbi:CXXX repeat peptide maturase [Barnesiella viscericola]|uniref:CXXX repeat peptide maturase n=1 Tax=Barnesiella viscericola TaxID=397865 RepID=UPI0023562B4D|nr:CXXX repeat peptide maturase [Barnesiella viscericola]